MEAEGRHFENLLNNGAKLNCRGKTKPKLPVDQRFRCNEAPARAAGLRDAIRNVRGISSDRHHHPDYIVVSLLLSCVAAPLGFVNFTLQLTVCK